jgi:hypothetical protein
VSVYKLLRSGFVKEENRKIYNNTKMRKDTDPVSEKL